MKLLDVNILVAAHREDAEQHHTTRPWLEYMYGIYKKLRNDFTGVLTGKGLDWGGSAGGERLLRRGRRRQHALHARGDRGVPAAIRGGKATAEEGMDWTALKRIEVVARTKHVRLARSAEPFHVAIDGRSSKGVVPMASG